MPLPKEIIARTLASSQGETAYKVVETLTDAGHDAWWVGGAVRDMLLGTVPADIDIATSALPQEVSTLFPKADPSAAVLGSIVLNKGKHRIEVTTFREDDAASDGRHPESVSFGKRPQDAKRRDLTVNAMYWHPISRELYDPFQGEEDLKERLIRFVGDPAIRIKHDALRALRAVRFRALLNGQYHPETYRALQEQAAMIEALSGTRLVQEIEKMLYGPRPDSAFEDLWEIGILKRILPELFDCKGIPQPKDYHHEGDVWEHTLMCMRAFKPEHSIDTRIAAAFHDTGKARTFSLKERIRFDHHATVSAEIAEVALKRLQMSGKRIEKISWLIKHHMTMATFLNLSEERKAHWYFHPYFSELLQVMWLDIAGTDPADFRLFDSIERDYHAFLDAHPRPERPLLSGNEVMEILGLKPGERVGEILKELHDAQMRREVTTKKEAREFLLRRSKH